MDNDYKEIMDGICEFCKDTIDMAKNLNIDLTTERENELQNYVNANQDIDWMIGKDYAKI